ncbi:MAG: PH domain-containing protein [Phycisphaerales bacterium]|nr:PH domain-containing protein [Phycisphaerales bacterium]
MNDRGTHMASEASGELTDSTPVIPSLSVQKVLQDDETVLMVLRPSPWFVVIDGAGVYLLILLGSLFCAWLGHKTWSPVAIPESQIFPACASLLMIRLIWKIIDWANRIYVLTDRRVLRRRGVIMLSIIEMPLRRMQHSAIYARVLERSLALGTIGFASAGSSGFEVVWEMVSDPVDVHHKVLEAVERYGQGPST